MCASRGGPASKPSIPKALAFYLPQYHPIPENDEWWGKGFTEWHNVTRAQPLFPGHYQPHIPGELGYYDLRVPEVRAAQAELAREHGVSGFVYYHYWFSGRRLLERPFEEVLASGEPDFPFALCWANEEWTRGWDARSGHVLMRQEYSKADDLAHIRWLLKAFADPRYITIDGRPVFLIYRPMLLPDAKRTTDLWRSEAQKAGFPDLYLCWVESWGPPPDDQGPEAFGIDASVGFMPLHGEQLHRPLETLRGHRVLDYPSAAQVHTELNHQRWKRFPSVMVGWDNTARRARGATIYDGATPEGYEAWLRATAASVADVRPEENYLFILAWNEWAEGNHLEPDLRYGRAFLEATRTVLLDPVHRELDQSATETGRDASGVGRTEPNHEQSVRFEEITATAVGLLGELQLDRAKPVIHIGSTVGDNLDATLGIRGIDVIHRQMTDPASLKAELDDVARPSAFVLLDVLEHLAEPQELLAALSTWSLDHGGPPLVVAVPHVGHLDVGLGLLGGGFDLGTSGPHDATTVRFFTEASLRRLFERSGWQLEARDDVRHLHTDTHPDELLDRLPEEMVGALHATAQAVNPNWSVTHFVWALSPVPVSVPPYSYHEAVRRLDDEPNDTIDPEATAALAEYLASVGLVVSEANRRAAAAQLLHGSAARSGAYSSLSYPKQVLLRIAYGSPRRAAMFKRVYGWLR